MRDGQRIRRLTSFHFLPPPATKTISPASLRHWPKTYELVLFYEKKLSYRAKDFTFDDKSVKQFCAGNGIDLATDGSPRLKNGAANKVRYSDSKKNEGVSLIAHIRNAFVHALINPWADDSTYLEFKDYSDPKTKKNINAYGIIKSEKLFELTDLVRKALKPKNNKQ